MYLTLRELNRYDGRIKSCQDGAYGYVRARVLDECAGFSISDARELAKSIVADAVDAFGMQAQAFAAEFWDEMAEAHGLETGAETFDGLTDPENIDKKVRYYARKLMDSDLDAFAEDCARRASFYVRREANTCTALNCKG